MATSADPAPVAPQIDRDTLATPAETDSMVNSTDIGNTMATQTELDKKLNEVEDILKRRHEIEEEGSRMLQEDLDLKRQKAGPELPQDKADMMQQSITDFLGRSSKKWDDIFEDHKVWAEGMKDNNSDGSVSTSTEDLCGSFLLWAIERNRDDPLYDPFYMLNVLQWNREGKPQLESFEAKLHKLGIKMDADVTTSTDQDPQAPDAGDPSKSEEGSARAIESGPVSVIEQNHTQPSQQDKGKGKGPEYALEALHISS